MTNESSKCPFCKIIKDGSERILKEGKYCFVVLSNPRLVLGHLLVIPKRHIEKLSKLSKKERNELFETAVEIQDKILAKFSSGCDLTQHFRPFVKQNRLKVDHLHIHLRPREFKDELYRKSQKYEVDLFKKINKNEFVKYKNLLFK